MGELAEILERTAFKTGRAVCAPKRDAGEEDDLEQRSQAESGPVETKLDISLFAAFNRDTVPCRGRKGAWISVSPTGEILLSSLIGEFYGEKARFFEAFLNKKGTIIVVRENAAKGFPARTYRSRKTQSKVFSCAYLKDELVKLGVKLPVRFYAEWDEGLKAWVGRR